MNAYNIQVALLGSKHELAMNIQDHLHSNPPQTVCNSLSGSSEGSTKMAVQALPAFGLSPSLDNLEIRLGSCEYGACLESESRNAACMCCVRTPSATSRLSIYYVGLAHFISVTATSDKLLENQDKDAGRTFAAHQEFYSPLLLAAPEAIQGGPGPRSAPINIWAVGHLVSLLLSVSPLPRASHRRQSRSNRRFQSSADALLLCDLDSCSSGSQAASSSTRLERASPPSPCPIPSFLPPVSTLSPRRIESDFAPGTGVL